LNPEIFKNQKFIMWALIVVCLLFVDYQFFLGPIFRRLGGTWPQVSELKRKIANAERSIAHIPKYEKEIEDLRSNLYTYKNKFSTEQQISLLLEKISNMAKVSSVKFTSIKPYNVLSQSDEDMVSSAYQKYPVSISATCGFHQLGKFLNRLENADAFMRVTDIRISEKRNTPYEHKAYMVINTYILSEGS